MGAKRKRRAIKEEGKGMEARRGKKGGIEKIRNIREIKYIYKM